MIFILLKCRISIVKDRYDAIREELSAAENREHVVEKEITENYRLSPDMQKGFDPIGQKNNDFRLAVALWADEGLTSQTLLIISAQPLGG